MWVFYFLFVLPNKAFCSNFDLLFGVLGVVNRLFEDILGVSGVEELNETCMVCYVFILKHDVRSWMDVALTCFYFLIFVFRLARMTNVET